MIEKHNMNRREETLVMNNRRYWSAGSLRRWLAERGTGEAAA
jgi:hypothetical protein